AHRGVGYYDITDPARPQLLGRYLADFDNVDPAAPPCARPPAGSDGRCAQDQFSVQLKRLVDGRVLSLSTRPDSTGSPSQDLRLVEVTDPRNPRQVGSWPVLGEAPSRTFRSNNGCSARSVTRSAEFSADGTKVLVPYFDGGLFVLDIADVTKPTQAGQWSFPNDWTVEGNAAYATPAQAGGRQLALVSEEDWMWPSPAFRVDAPPAVAGIKFGCAAFYTLFETSYRAQVHRQPGGQLPGELVYIGPGCTAQRDPTGTLPEDPYLGDPRGKIAFASAAFCFIPGRARRAQDAGAVGIVSYRDALVPEANSFFPTPGMPKEPEDGRGALVGEVLIPEVTIKKPDGDALRAVLCPTVVGGQCSGGQKVTGAMVDLPGEWGGMRIIDTTDPASPAEVATYRPELARVMPPPDHRGVYSVHHAVVDGARAYAAWNSAGLRVVDLSNPAAPVEVASFIAPDTSDPTGTVPAKSYVTGVAVTARHVVVTDINSGLWVLTKPGAAAGPGSWLAAADGGVFALGRAPFLGSAGGLRLARPVVGLAPSPTGKGYWLVASDGGVFAFGDATFKGSTGGRPLAVPIVGMAPTPSGAGYWLVAGDGGVFAFGDAVFAGSAAGRRLSAPVVGVEMASGSEGYWLAGADGGVFAFGTPFGGSLGGTRVRAAIVAMAGLPR
ncbi:MAG: hypothetical protein ABIW46_03770, partial [Acidimicrobiales bacterium]